MKNQFQIYTIVRLTVRLCWSFLEAKASLEVIIRLPKSLKFASTYRDNQKWSVVIKDS